MGKKKILKINLKLKLNSVARGRSRRLGLAPVARGRCVRFVVFLQPSGGALIGCARNRKSFRHMAPGLAYSETSTNYC